MYIFAFFGFETWVVLFDLIITALKDGAINSKKEASSVPWLIKVIVCFASNHAFPQRFQDLRTLKGCSG